MKRKLIKIAMIGLVTGALIMTNIFMPQSTNSVLAEEEEEYWVGDMLLCGNGSYHVTKYTVLEGESVEVFEEYGQERVRAVKEGYSRIQAEYYNYKQGPNGGYEEDLEFLELVGTKIFEFNVVERPDEVKFIDIPKSIKLGQEVDFTVENANYGSLPCICISEPNNSFCMPGYGGELDSRTYPGYLFTAVKYDVDGTIIENAFNITSIALYPGTYTYEMYADNRFHNSIEPLGTGTLIVEEPVIETNAPETVNVGSVLDIKTSLTNLYMEDEEVVKLFKAIYEPEITILEGAECVERSNMKYEDLSTAESMKFVKNGTVKLRIRYVADVDYDEYSSESEIYYPLDGNYIPELYTAEKIITITVSDEKINDKTEITGGVISKEEAGKLESEAVVEGVGKDTKLEISTIATTDEGYKAVASNSTVQGKKFAVLDLKLLKEGITVQPEGKIKVTLPVMDNIKEAKYVEVLRLDETSKKLDSLGIVAVENGKITFETEHFSTYVFLEASESPEIPDTGDLSNKFAPLLMLISVVLLVGCAIYNKRKTIGE